MKEINELIKKCSKRIKLPPFLSASDRFISASFKMTTTTATATATAFAIAAAAPSRPSRSVFLGVDVGTGSARAGVRLSLSFTLLLSIRLLTSNCIGYALVHWWFTVCEHFSLFVLFSEGNLRSVLKSTKVSNDAKIDTNWKDFAGNLMVLT